MAKETYFAPAKRTDRRVFKNQIADISRNPIMNALLQTSAGLLVVLNDDRQIVAINHTFLQKIGVADAEKVLGLRLGETLHCIHAHAEPNGCGTTPQCVTCGAAIAMMKTINDDIGDEQICTLTAASGGMTDDICLKIRSQPLHVDGQRWILLFARDITQEQIWRNLERVFFHDINNSLASLVGFSEILALDLPENLMAQQIHQAACRLTGEIGLQRTLSKKQDTRHWVNKFDTSLERIRQDLDLLITGLPAGKAKHLAAEWPSAECRIHTDPLLVTRVLGNMIINAFEASPHGGTVRLRAIPGDEGIRWEVWNAGFIEAHNQLRVFQRYFSTKADKGRGLGTFSMRLFGENYLGGKVGFVSEPLEGTTFFLYLPLN